MKAILLGLILMLVNRAWCQLPATFIAAMHQVEASGREGPIYGDGCRALGPMQIHWDYWNEATQFDKTIGGNYTDCQSLAYSTKVVNAYMRRYMPLALKRKDWKAIALRHNGGGDPQYWQKMLKAGCPK